MDIKYGLRLLGPTTKKWNWHKNADGTIREYTKERAEYFVTEYWDKKIAKVQKITAKSK
jgi:hypothetical protein